MHVLVSFQVQEIATEQNGMPAVKRLNVELIITKDKLDAMLGGLGKIRDQFLSFKMKIHNCMAAGS